MNSRLAAFAMGATMAAALASIAYSEQGAGHRVVLPNEMKWGPAPSALPAGAEAAVLFGDPSKDGLFALRVKVPRDYLVAPHTHTRPEIVTVLSGKINLGMGVTAGKAATQPVGAGGFVSIQPETPHYVFAAEETVLQITSTGPWVINYVDPKDDPRLNVAPLRKEGGLGE